MGDILRQARNNVDLPLQFFTSALHGLGDAKLFSAVESYCMFVGYPRSGHSLVGSLLDAHPEAVIAHELDALRFVRAGFGRSQLYSQLLRNSQGYGERREIVYDYTVPNQWQGRFRRIRVIGDKKGGRSTWRLGEAPRLLQRLQKVVGVPIRFIHVIRNPFDNIATIYRRSAPPGGLTAAADRYIGLCATMASLADRLGPDPMLEIRHEELLSDPAETIARLCSFVGLEADPGFVSDCAGILFEAPNRTRDSVDWPAPLVDRVDAAIERYPFLRGYSYA
ncbi:MAG: sulfotransferase family protein [Acidimicrobiales bacterium]